MIKTLHGYLSRDLAKVTGLALAAFTVIMTIFAIIEPLRREGVAPTKCLALIGFALPMMTSLTLPVAALFAATIVYGRFSQDNELMACRASGISTITLLRPAFGLGAIVTVLSLILTSLVTPYMAKMLETSVMASARSYAFSRLRRKNHFDLPGRGHVMIHADAVDEERDVLYGVVVADTKRPGDVRLIVATRAYVRFMELDGDTYLTAELVRPAVARTGSYDIVQQGSYVLDSRKLQNPAKEEPSWYGWPKLVKTIRNPTENLQVRKFFEEEILRALCHDMLARSIVSAIQSGKPYTELQSEQHAYEILAGNARAEPDGTVHLESTSGPEGVRPVEVRIFREGEPYQIVTADNGRIETTFSVFSQKSLVSIELLDNVRVFSLRETPGAFQRRTQYAIGQLPIPERLGEMSKGLSVEDVFKHGEELTDSTFIQAKIRQFKEEKVPRLINKIKAEMHRRMAYSLSCFLMVAMGAALGLLFKGGQVISAFALSMIPAVLVILMMITGKQMLHSRSVPAYIGLATIWSGVIALLIADAAIYFHLSRK